MDGAGNARGAARKCIDILKSNQHQMPPFPQLLTLLNMTLLGLGAESTFLGMQVKEMFLNGMSCGDSPLWVVRDGQLLRINKNTKPRLGTSRPHVTWFALALKKHDVIVAASDGLNLDRYRLVQIVHQCMLRPSEMAEALLNSQADCSDDVTVITRVV